MKRTASLLFSALLCAASFAATAHDFVQPRPGLHTGGQPSRDDLARLQAEGVRTVIDLRAPQEDRGYDQAAEVRRLGMDYIARRNDLVAGVTQADIRRAAARTFADGKMLVVAAGRPTDF